MIPAPRAPEAPPPARSLGLSVAFHVLLLSLVLLLPGLLRLLAQAPPPPMEIEITSPFLGDGAPKLGAPKPLVPGKLAPVNRTADKALIPKTPPIAKPVAPPPKDWVLPAPSTKVLAPPKPAAAAAVNGGGTQTTPGGAAGGEGTAAKTGGSGEGSDAGVPGGHGHGGTPLLAWPKLLNRDEVLANLRRLYPEAERAAGHEADVSVVIHIGIDGTVGVVDVTLSATPAFDEAARKVGRLMRFSPAIGLDGRPVPVSLPQPIQFRLEN
ncbi:MAG TPA: TonB family protein [Elusimicrobiota bacterium]|jgi:TonB family protein|nr:TonB family protein [Elusimicrobiota bacterium]